MALYETSNILDTSIYMKARLDKNMVGTNYYIENLQHKRNADWEKRYNRIDIEEELDKQCNYTNEFPVYTPIEAVITNVKSEKGQDLGPDWAKLAFKDLKHPNGIGSRYRFSLDFEENPKMLTEEEKYYNTSIWLAINKAPVKAGNSCVVRRCNTSLKMVGSPTMDKNYITELHEEPCVLENDLKYMQIYYNETLPVPQAEWYATMQLNYFTNYIELNDRFVFGVPAIDSEDRSNNQLYIVKAIIKSTSNHTFIKDEEDAIKSTPLIIIALDKEAIGPDDDIVNRIANDTTLYRVVESKIPIYYEPYIEISKVQELNGEVVDDFDYKIPQGQKAYFKANLMCNGELIDEPVQFKFSGVLTNILEKNWDNYFEIKEGYDSNNTDGSHKFYIINKKRCLKGKLIVTALCEYKNKQYEQSFGIELGGLY